MSLRFVSQACQAFKAVQVFTVNATGWLAQVVTLLEITIN